MLLFCYLRLINIFYKLLKRIFNSIFKDPGLKLNYYLSIRPEQIVQLLTKRLRGIVEKENRAECPFSCTLINLIHKVHRINVKLQDFVGLPCGHKITEGSGVIQCRSLVVYTVSKQNKSLWIIQDYSNDNDVNN